jgi:hypothetical protein
LRLTDSLNLPAPGRRQTLYVLLSSSQSPVFLVNSRYPLLSATPVRSRSESFHGPGHTFSRSYGVNLPSSLTWVLSSALACSAHLPESVYGTVTRRTPYEAFLGSMGSLALRAYGSRRHLSALNGGTDLPVPPAYGLEPGHPTPGRATLLRPPFGRTFSWWYGNIDPFPIAYGFRPRLRGRLTLSRLALLRNP